MKPPPKNMATSVRERLSQLAVRHASDFQQVLTSFAIERLLFRLSISAHARNFVLKGETFFTLWEGFPHRQTRDLYLFGFGENSIERLADVFRQNCAMPVVRPKVNWTGWSIARLVGNRPNVRFDQTVIVDEQPAKDTVESET